MKSLPRKFGEIGSTCLTTYKKIPELRVEDVTTVTRWLAREQNITSGEIQNELLLILSHTVLRELCKDVRSMSSLLGIIVHGTQDIESIGQESLFVRYVTDTFDVREHFLGLYDISATTGQSISRMLVEALTMLQLPNEHLRAQTYDGVSNRSGKYSGCQAELETEQPLAKYVHCGAHITHRKLFRLPRSSMKILITSMGLANSKTDLACTKTLSASP